ncbi:hypothetical protein [Planctomicrobium sp. SH527]|uniref:hypothetical protein n=1 Tax=Planctomicrobium sp. SH527 TaxID=3448123 RepID=UPI003F5CADF1
MTPNRVPMILGGLFLGALVLSPFLAQGDPHVLQIQQHNASVISKMSQTERERLLRNYSDYQAMTPQKREQMQLLHHQLEQDRLQSNGELSRTIEIYNAWLKTLNPLQRNQLMTASSSRERLNTVQEVLKRQREEAARRSMPPLGPPGDRPFLMATGMDSATRGKIVEALEKTAEPRLSAQQKEELNGLKGLKRELRLLQILKEFGTGVSPQPLFENPPAEFVTVANEIANYTSNPQLLDFIQSAPLPPPPQETPESSSRRDGKDSGRRLAFSLFHSYRMDLDQQRHMAEEAERNTDSRKLEEFLATLPVAEQNELLSLEATDFQTDLKGLYLDSKVLANLPTREQLNELFIGSRGAFSRRRFGNDRFGPGGRPPRRMDGRDPMDGRFGPPPGGPGGPPPGRPLGPDFQGPDSPRPFGGPPPRPPMERTDGPQGSPPVETGKP